MKRHAFWLVLAPLALAVATSASAHTSTYFGFQIGIGSAPPPPVVVYEAPPPVYYEPAARVYVVRGGYDDYDMFRYGPYWYMCNDGYWYRARTYRGPFVVVDVRTVPRPIFSVPAPRWRHYPRELRAWNAGSRGYGRGWKQGHEPGWRGKEQGRGHGHGHGDD